MQIKDKAPWNASLKGRLVFIIMTSLASSIIVFMLMISVTRGLIDNYFDDAEKWAEKTELKAEELQQFVTENNLASRQAYEIERWRNSNTGVYLYIFNGKNTIYETANDLVVLSGGIRREIAFSDCVAELEIFYAVDYKYYNMIAFGEALVSIGLFLFMVWMMLTGLLDEIKALEHDVRIIESGGLDYRVKVRSIDELGSLEKSIDDMRIAFKRIIDREEEMVRANNELVTRMAHDLRTPLTSIMLYLDLISEGNYENEEQLKKYMDVVRTKAEGIKAMSDRMFERFLVSGANTDDSIELEDVRYALEDPLSSFIMTLEVQGFKTESRIKWPKGKVPVSIPYINRIMENINSNIMKYGDRDVPVVLEVNSMKGNTLLPLELRTAAGDTIQLIVKNRVNKKRGPVSDTNRIGLENIRIMMGRMGGTVKTTDHGDSFETHLVLPLQPD